MSASRTSTAARAPKSTAGADLARMRRAPTHPGEILLKEFLEPHGFGAQAAAAKAMGMSKVRLNQIIGGHRAMTAETCVLVAALTGTSPQFWAHLQADHDVWRALRTVDTTKVEKLKAPA
jgi:addiction module HigA family antidote